MKHNQKGSSSIPIIIVVIAVLVAAALYIFKGTNIPPSNSTQQTTTSTNQSIQDDAGLTSASQDLDNADVDTTLDPELNQNTVDASNF